MIATLLPAPSRPRRHQRTRTAVRADRIRRWLSIAPDSLDGLCIAMQCTRFEIRQTVRTMPDVTVERIDGRNTYTLHHSADQLVARAGGV